MIGLKGIIYISNYTRLYWFINSDTILVKIKPSIFFPFSISFIMFSLQ